MTSLIQLSQVEMSYEGSRGGPVVALQPTDLEIAQGEFVSIIGPSGCGKSTLLYIVGGVRRPTGGRVEIDGTTVTAPMPDKIAFVFQDYTLYPWRSVLRNVEFGPELAGVPKAERREIALQYLDLVGLSEFTEAYPAELSGGMQQRVALARALAIRPEILLLDEPFGALDEQTRMVLGDDVCRISATQNKTALFVTHSLSEAIFLADRIVVMSSRPGRIKAILPVDEERPRKPAFRTSTTFTELNTQLFELLHEEFEQAALAEMKQQFTSPEGVQ